MKQLKHEGERTSSVLEENSLCPSKGLSPNLRRGDISTLLFCDRTQVGAESVEEDAVERARGAVHVDLDLLGELEDGGDDVRVRDLSVGDELEETLSSRLQAETTVSVSGDTTASSAARIHQLDARMGVKGEKERNVRVESSDLRLGGNDILASLLDGLDELLRARS